MVMGIMDWKQAGLICVEASQIGSEQIREIQTETLWN